MLLDPIDLFDLTDGEGEFALDPVDLTDGHGDEERTELPPPTPDLNSRLVWPYI